MASTITGNDIRKAINKAIKPINRKSFIGEYEYMGFKKISGNKVKVTLFDIHNSITIIKNGRIETIDAVTPTKGFHKTERIIIENINGADKVIIKDMKMPEHTLCKLAEAIPMTKLLDSKPEYWLDKMK